MLLLLDAQWVLLIQQFMNTQFLFYLKDRRPHQMLLCASGSSIHKKSAILKWPGWRLTGLTLNTPAHKWWFLKLSKCHNFIVVVNQGKISVNFAALCIYFATVILEAKAFYTKGQLRSSWTNFAISGCKNVRGHSKI